LLLVVLAKLFPKSKSSSVVQTELPAVTLFVAAWNERDSIVDKVKNSLEIDYPADKLTFLWVTDGSDDGTPEMLQQYPQMKVLHESVRNGKIGAMNRGMKQVTTPIVVFCDANTFLNKESIRQIVSSFEDPTVGCVAGEKRIFAFEKDTASGSGEGFYWKIESFLKKTESNFGSTVGAAGELFAIRTELFQDVEADTILDDFLISMRIASKGYKVKYNPNAIATEMSSATIFDELKRKERIAAGGFQVIPRLKTIINPFNNFWLSFTFISHKLLRWTVLPLAFILALLSNYCLLYFNHSLFYRLLFLLQLMFYLATYIGYVLQNKSIKNKIFFVPYYLIMMNYAIILGFFKYRAKKQHVNWDRSKRAVIK
jgi:cellulose synthase/poly-beta-1,6-N-acetylglucosamine synthase-like glycosyltransferase